jgi:hypothetical protein
MASSLGTVSGILNQFSDYQTKKEQAELRGEAIEHQMTMQGFQGEQAILDHKGAQIQTSKIHESVKQQNIKLAQAQRAVADAEFDNEYANKTAEQREAFDISVREDIEKQKAAREEAARAVEAGNPKPPGYSPLFNERMRRLTGAEYASDFPAYYKTKADEYREGLSGLEDGNRLTEEQTREMAESIVTKFMEENNLNPDDAMGDGFLSSVRHFNNKMVPETASQLMQDSEARAHLTLSSVINGVANETAAALANEEMMEDIKSQDWHTQLQALTEPEQLAVLMGKDGAFSMARTEKELLKFQLLVDGLGESMTVGGKLFKDHPLYGGYLADIEDAVIQRGIKEVQDEDNGYVLAQKAVIEPLQKIGAESFDALDQRSINLVKADDTNDTLRARLYERFPELADIIGTVPEDRLFRFANYLTKQVRGISGDRAALTARQLGLASKNYQRRDGVHGLTQTMLAVKMKADVNPGEQTSAISLLIDTFITGQGLTGGIGLTKEGGGYLVRELDEFSEGLLTTYTRGLNNLDQKVREGLAKGASSEQYNIDYNAGLAELDKNLEEGLLSVFTKHTKDNRRFLEAVDLVDTDHGAALNALGQKPGFEGVEEALLYDLPFLKGIMVGDEKLNIPGNKSLTHEEALDFIKYHKKMNQQPSAAVLTSSFPEDPANARIIAQSFAIQKATASEKTKDWLLPGGVQHRKITMLSNRLAKDHYPVLADGAVKRYKETIGKANEAAAGELSYLVNPEKIADIATGCFPNWTQPSLQSTQRIVIIDGDDFLTLRKKGDTSKYPSGHARRIAPVKQDIYGNAITSSDWRGLIKENVTVAGNFFEEKQTAITGLPFGTIPPTHQGDVEEILSAVGWTEHEFRAIHYKYGYEDGLTFLKAQYNHSYYTNHRAGGTTPPPYTPPSYTP